MITPVSAGVIFLPLGPVILELKQAIDFYGNKIFEFDKLLKQALQNRTLIEPTQRLQNNKQPSQSERLYVLVQRALRIPSQTFSGFQKFGTAN